MKKIACFVILSIIISSSLWADEGMWLLTQLDQLDLQKKGLKLKVDEIYNPQKPSVADAIIWLGGCSASFVSPDGLMLTNHHCAHGALQRASTEGTDYIKNGFLAQTRADELEAKGVTASVLQEMKDVTNEVLKAAEGIKDPVERQKKIDAKIVEMTDKIEGDKEDVRAQIVAMYNGKQYLLFVYKRYQDVRIVYAPPQAIGNYGGDIDNWMWPRHTGDFTFMRVYMAPDESGAKYSPDNVPVKPKNYLPVAKDFLKEGDLTFILGYPGYTTRWRTSNSVGWNLKYNYPETVKDFQEIIDLLDNLTKDSEEGKIKVANTRAGLANTMKNFQGRIECMTKSNFLQQKIDFEKELMAYINSDKKLKKEYGNVLDKIKALYDKLALTKEKDDVIRMFGFSGILASLGREIYGVAKEREKPDDKRDPNFTEKGVQRTVERLHLRYYSYYEPTDKAMLKRVLEKANALPEALRIKGLEYIFSNKSQPLDDFVNDAYAESKLSDVEYAKPLFEKSVKELEALNDPFIKMAAMTYEEREDNDDRYDEFAANITELRKEYLNALLAWKGKGLYPDANGTMRFTSGPVAGYQHADAVWYQPFTTLQGVIDKNTGVEPFDMPPKLADLHAKKDFGKWADPRLKDVPVAFTHICDITGGNSGSAVMNAKGELIGLAFDGNYEAMTSDWQYDNNMQRTISVDIHYVLFVTEKFAGADYILKEMGLK
ncbi:S46 family peptidase [candidate division KSB1 bacterium]|nr:S46 family peptidase [candidate division KSB1 bacterium]